METMVHLLYFEGCPNVEQARQNLRAALSRAGRRPVWTEINVQSDKTPQKWRGFPSPTILVYGREIASGADAAAGTGACRFGGAPSVEVILASLPGKARSWLASLAALPAAAMGLFPAVFCPACYPALVGLLSALGLGAMATDAILKPLMVLFLAVAVGGLAWQTRRTKNPWPLSAGLTGAAGVYLTVFVIASVTLKAASVGLLIGASIWNAIPSLRMRKVQDCPACNDAGGTNGKEKS